MLIIVMKNGTDMIIFKNSKNDNVQEKTINFSFKYNSEPR